MIDETKNGVLVPWAEYQEMKRLINSNQNIQWLEESIEDKRQEIDRLESRLAKEQIRVINLERELKTWRDFAAELQKKKSWWQQFKDFLIFK